MSFLPLEHISVCASYISPTQYCHVATILNNEKLEEHASKY